MLNIGCNYTKGLFPSWSMTFLLTHKITEIIIYLLFDTFIGTYTMQQLALVSYLPHIYCYASQYTVLVCLPPNTCFANVVVHCLYFQIVRTKLVTTSTFPCYAFDTVLRWYFSVHIAIWNGHEQTIVPPHAVHLQMKSIVRTIANGNYFMYVG